MINKLLSKGKKYDNMGMIEVGGGNMKRSKGFTLIELLAVIVILAIIALIATPIILNIINDSREKSNQRSVEGLKKATETTIGEIMMDSDYTGSDIVCKLGSNISDGEMSKDGIDDDETYCWDIGAPEGTLKQVTYSGSRVKAGSITFNKETGKVSIADAQVGSSSKKYTTEKSDSALTVIANKLDPNDDSSIFRDHYGNIRYRGKSPNNYVTFNGKEELWRIIGIVDGKVKLIRETSIGDYSWDSSSESVNDGFGVNEWSQADLMNLLNNGAYWNRTSGECYIDKNNATSECNFSSTGLTNDAKKMISESVWHLGGHDQDPEDVTLDNMYIMIDREKGTNVYSNPEDDIARTTRWTGYVGLMYPSDYGYAADKRCKSNLYSYDNTDEELGQICSYDGNWLSQDINKETGEWVLTPASDDAYDAWNVNFGKYVNYDDNVSGANRVRPVINLKPEVKITGGSGTKTDPYELSM